MKTSITTHVLDTTKGKPAVGIRVELEMREASGDWKQIASGATDTDGRLNNLIKEQESSKPGTYRLTFETGTYFDAISAKSFYPFVSIVFRIDDPAAHYHVPLLLSPFGYSTYRGS